MSFFRYIKQFILTGTFLSMLAFAVFWSMSLLQAAGGQVDPDGAGLTTQGTRTTCATAANYDCVNDGVSSTTVPNTTGDFITFARNQFDSYTLGTILNVATATAINVFIYHKEGSTNMQFNISLWNAAESVQIGATLSATTSTVSQWDSVSFTGLALNQATLDALRVRTLCNKPGAGGGTNCIDYALYAYVTYTPVTNITVSTTSAMQNLDVGTTSAHVGGAFVIQETSVASSTRNVTSITIAEGGTVNASANLKNIKLLIDYDTTNPYNCASESYQGNESQYGSTDTDGFSTANGISTFSSSTVSASTTRAICVYPVLDVQSSASAGETLSIRITDPTVDVVGSGSAVVGPTSTVPLFGTTTLQKTDLRQMRYHWRNDNGNEGTASSATGGAENTVLAAIQQLSPRRLRLEVSNEGNKTSASTAFRLEYAQKISTCSAASGWTDVGGGGGDWDMYNSTFVTDGNDTIDISNAIGGVTNENTTLKSPNAGMKDTSSQVTATTLTSSEYMEMEFSIAPTTNASEGNTYCFRVTNSGTVINVYDVYPEATIASDIIMSATSTQVANVQIPNTKTYAGGTFVIQKNTPGSTTITGITLSASGTVDKQNNIDNLILRYDLDTSAPYNCASESYSGSKNQYGATSTNGFDGSNMALFTQSLVASTTQTICLYIEFDVSSIAVNGNTIDFYINNPNDDVTRTTGTLSPNAPLPLAGVTTFLKSDVQQLHYHWRTDTGTETTATSATNGTEDTPLASVTKGLVNRIRIGVSNEGGTSTSPHQFRLEYAQKTASCSSASGWTDVGATNDAWNMIASQITEGADTTNISNSIGGVSDENANFLSTNGGQRETASQTGNLTIASTTFAEFEYSLVASTSATAGATYCFRLTNAGTALDTYVRYPEATVKQPTDFLIQRGATTTTAGTVTIRAGIDYVAPSASTSAFVRITNTHHTGAGNNVASGNQSSNDVTVYIVNPSNIMNSVTFSSPGSTADTRIAWEIVEYAGAPGGENEIVVRQQSAVTYGPDDITATTSAVSGVVTDSDIVPFITGQFNPDTGRADYNTGLSTSAWNASNDTASFTRGESNSDAVIVSYAVIEFVGSNWVVQRTPDHTYTNAGSTETESITAVNSLSRTFVHAQKRVGSGLDQHEDYGHEVWLSSIGQVSFRLDSGANTPSGHVSVGWVIENTQTTGNKMEVTRSNATQSEGTAPLTLNVDIGKTLSDLTIASIFINNSGSGAATSWPEPMISARIISTTQYELWMSNTGNSRAYQTEIVEWPTAVRRISQSYYRFYVNNDALDPTDPWPAGATDLGENAEVTGLDGPIANQGVVRIRMSLVVNSAAMVPGIDAFKLQYAPRSTTCSAIPESSWNNLGNSGSTTALWRGTTTPQVDGTALSTDPPAGGALNLSVSDVAGTFEEENNTTLTPFIADPGEDVEFDWAIQNNGATDKTSYCFRMTEADGTLLFAYNFYPTIRTVGYGVQSQDWRWYDDAQSETPTSTLATTNTAPIDIDFDNAIKLRLTLKEVNGAVGTNAKFRLQFSEYSDFSTSTNVAEIGDCTNLAYWCYADGGGVDNAVITTKTISDADTCSGGIGNGCGTHNESGTTTSTFNHQINAATEFSFTIKSSGARPNRVYYFRVYDVANDELVPLGSGEVYPSLVTKGASLQFTMSGLASTTVIAGVTLDIDTTFATVPFGSLPASTTVEGAHRLAVDTNGTQGYKLLMMMTSDLESSLGARISPITGTNASPVSWNTGCSISATSCLGYHTTDATLEGGSARFSPIDTYARFSTTMLEEISYSSQPTINETTDVIFRVLRRELQDPGRYEARIRYISVPVF